MNKRPVNRRRAQMLNTSPGHGRQEKIPTTICDRIELMDAVLSVVAWFDPAQRQADRRSSDQAARRERHYE